MATLVRPAFYEGQVLAAGDLTATVEQARGAVARHNRHQHDWGIAQGLTLTKERRTDPDNGSDFVAVTVQPGVAVDGTGREIVVAEPVALEEAAFRQTNGADQPTTQLYPVFLAGRDAQPQSVSLLTSACGGTAQPTRVEEAYQVIFGRLGDERFVDDQVPPAVDAGPGNGTVPWRVLLGFVLWQNGHFADEFDTSGSVGRRYAGVRADTVVARSGRLMLRPDPAAEAGRSALVLDGGEGTLTFGRLKGDGSVDRLLEVNPQGDLYVGGTLQIGGPTPRVLVTSGTATDGMLLPLPQGVTQVQVDAGRVDLHLRVTPRLERPAALPSGLWALGPVTCTVDAERRLLSLVRWLSVDTKGAFCDLPAAADFLVLATVAGDGHGGGTP
ncbi:hypothetical protein [Modestobacter excelsi]|uniref:hypothetical protein n=1 Tax=Modestobacter excelsi TaxID=2213161 RepID=UPI00110CE77E|nr:hypothetical protein [Modestobacter excelsi]